MALKMDKGMKSLMNMDKDFKKIMLKVSTDAFEIMVGKTTKGSRDVQVIINNFRKKWTTQRKFADLKDPTKKQKKRNDEGFLLVSSGKLKEAVKNSIKVRLSGAKIIATVTVPDYGEYIQNGTLNMEARPFFSIEGSEKLFFGLIESLLTLEFNKLGIRAKEL